MADKTRVPQLQQQSIQMTGAFCLQHADEQYAQLCRKLIEKMGRKRTVPFVGGQPRIWTAAVALARCFVEPAKQQPFRRALSARASL